MVRNRRNLRSSQGIALQVGREVTIMNSLPAIVFPPTVCFPPLPIDATPMLRATSYSLLLFAAALLLAPNSASAKKPAALEGPIVFETHVRPIFKAHCFHCHGEAGDVQGGLDVRLVRLLSKGGESGPAFTAGDHKKSFLFERIESQEMPPGEKKLSPTEIATIARWIDQGAKTLKPEPETISEITDDDRAFWSFQPIVRPPLPKVRDAARVATPIDAFLLAELEQKNLGFSLQADAATLIRRLYFDLLGLPPTPAEVAAFVKDKSPQAYEKLVDKLLASPHYGERWGRHWLDVAGYADSDGYTPLDPVRKHVYKYRDYVIRSFNDDKPWNEFIVEQLAGDELVSLPYNGKTGAELDRLIATGFLRMGPDGTSDTSVDQPLARNDVLVETVKIVSTSLLGLSVGCAQCHSHRYDPIPQADYYAFRALFEPAYDPLAWRQSQSRLISNRTAEQNKQIKAADAAIAKIQLERNAANQKLIDEVFELELAKLPKELQATARKGRTIQPTRRTMEQADVYKKYPALTYTPEAVKKHDPKRYAETIEKHDVVLAKLKSDRSKIAPPEEFIHALTEVPGKNAVTKLFYRGDHTQPRDEVKPAELTILTSFAAEPVPVDDPKLPTTGRRLTYAQHLTSGKHPLVARVLVNRFWLHHFGRGIVSTPGDFGFLGEKPSHPELLDWLADDFMRNDWRLKPFHKQVLMSTAYRQSSRRTDALDAVDPDNVLLGRMSVRRLEAETLRDAVLAVAGNLNRKQFGPAVPVTPNETGQVILGIDTRDGAGRFLSPIGSVGDEAFRRSVYIQARRSLPLGMLETFDAPEMTPNCECRTSSTVTPQSLLLMNSDFVTKQSEVFAARVAKEAGQDRAKQVRLAWQSAFGVDPSNEQVAAASQFVTTQIAVFDEAAKKNPTPKPAANAPAPKTPPPVPPTPELLGLASFCQSLLSANAFLYID